MRRTMVAVAAAAALTVSAVSGPVLAQDPVQAEPGQDVNMLLLPKFLGIIVFDQANEGARKPPPSWATRPR